MSPGATEFKDDSKGMSQSAKNDREELYQSFFLARARYTLTVTRAGFRKESRTVDVLLGLPVRVGVALEITTANTTVTVSGEVLLIESELGNFSVTTKEVGWPERRLRMCRSETQIVRGTAPPSRTTLADGPLLSELQSTQLVKLLR